ncbi:hypothetical protein CYMTET_14167 [Cymbomonas tetramitiformis]|uniref:Uncharacterized protein n=1 Tax=Cymbomonas tetramitiformis TaxID=36881 RepID=A0AAE0GGV2_9CHLO|nr:hypothetical protein CYMTET_14167 [Cymbomonas tetramitiformis]
MMMGWLLLADLMPFSESALQLFECVGDSSTARFLGVSWIRLTLAPSPCTVLMVITHARGLVFFDLDMKYWRIAVNGDGRRVEVGFGRRLSLWCHSGGHCLLESSVDSSVVLRGEAEVLMVITHAGGLVFFDLDMKYWRIAVNGDGRRVEESGEQFTPYCGTGWHMAIGANRISYVLDLCGPSMAINTACSSSLVCIETAAAALRHRSLRAAVAGGANLQLRRVWSDAFSTAGMLSPSFKCKFGDDSADGYVRGEGVAAALLAVLPTAVDERTPVGEAAPYAVLAGSALHQDGHSNGLMAPNPAAQVVLLKAAYEDAQIDPADVAYVEAHGTGTRLGDPIELNALGRAGVGAGEGLRVGTVKSNIGHLECAAGMAGLVKAALVLQRDTVPASLHFHKPNELVDFAALRIRVVTGTESLSGASQGSLAPKQSVVGVSGNGFGGTLGHVVLSQAPMSGMSRASSGATLPPDSEAAAAPASSLVVVRLSAHSDAAVRLTAARVAGWLEAGNLQLESGAAALEAARPHVGSASRYKVAASGHDVVAVAAALREIGSGSNGGPAEARVGIAGAAVGVVPGAAANAASRRVALLFTGQGSEYVHMGRALSRSNAAFREAFDEVSRALQPHLAMDHHNLAEVLFSDDEARCQKALKSAAFLQPAIFALEYALATALLARGAVKPVAVAGHSLGEISAMAVAGVLSLADAAALVAGRGRAMAQLPSGVSGMAAVMAEEPQVTAVLERLGGSVEIAAVNSALGLTISGPSSSLSKAVTALEMRGVKCKMLDVVAGMHSACIEQCLPGLRAVAEKLQPGEPGAAPMTVVSSALGKRLEAPPDADYWCRQARGRVRFMEAARCLVEECGAEVIVEVGPSAHLTPHVNKILAALDSPKASAVAVISTLKGPKQAEAEGGLFCAALSALHCAGVPVPAAPAAPPPAAMRLPATGLAGDPYWFGEGMESYADPVVQDGPAAGSGAGTGPRVAGEEPDTRGKATALEEEVLYSTEWVKTPSLEYSEERKKDAPPPLVNSVLVIGYANCAAARQLTNCLIRSHVQVEAVEVDSEGQGVMVDRVRAGPRHGPGETYQVPAKWDLVVFVGKRLQTTAEAMARAMAARAKELEIEEMEMGSLTRVFSTDSLASLGDLNPSGSSGDMVGMMFSALGSQSDLNQLGQYSALGGPSSDSDNECSGLLLSHRGIPQVDSAGSLGGGNGYGTLPSGPPGGKQDTSVQPEPILAASGALLALLQEAEVTGQRAGLGGGMARLAVVTHGAHGQTLPEDGENGGPETGAAGAALWGLLRSARQEFDLLPAPPLLHVVDVDPTLTPLDAASRIAAELLSASDVFGADDVRIVVEAPAGAHGLLTPTTGRRVRRLCPVQDHLTLGSPRATPPVKPEMPECVAITGGTGNLGLVVAEYLVKGGCKHVLLLSRRRAVPKENLDLYQSLLDTATSCGAKVELEEVNVTMERKVYTFVSKHSEQLRGVVHCAGILDDGLLGKQTNARLARQMDAKALGGLYFHKACLAYMVELSMFVTFSSVTALLGNRGQVGYGAANSVLDYLCTLRRHQNKPALSVQWGPWAEVGMASHGAANKQIERSVYRGLKTAEALKAFGRLLKMSVECAPVVAVSSFNWENVQAVTGESAFQGRLWSDIISHDDSAQEGDICEDSDDETTSAADCRAGASSMPQAVNVAEEVLRVVRKYSPEGAALQAPAAGTELADLGLDSIEGMSMVQDINRSLGTSAGFMDLMGLGTWGALLAYVEEHAAAVAPAPASTPRKKSARASSRPSRPASSPALTAVNVVEEVLRIVRKYSPEGAALQAPAAGTELADLGLDSIEGMSMVQDINRSLGTSAGFMDLMGLGTWGALLAYVEEHAAAVAPAPASTPRKKSARASSRPSRPASSPAPTAVNVAEEVLRIVRKYSPEGAALQAPAAGTELADLGLDSIEGMSMVQDINRSLGTSAGFMDLMGLGTWGALLAYVEEHAAAVAPAPACKPRKKPARPNAKKSSGATPQPATGRGGAAHAPKAPAPMEVAEIIVLLVNKHLEPEQHVKTDSNATLTDLGLDSIEGMALVQRINESFSTKLTLNDLLEAGDLKRLEALIQSAPGFTTRELAEDGDADVVDAAVGESSSRRSQEDSANAATGKSAEAKLRAKVVELEVDNEVMRRVLYNEDTNMLAWVLMSMLRYLVLFLYFAAVMWPSVMYEMHHSTTPTTVWYHIWRYDSTSIEWYTVMSFIVFVHFVVMATLALFWVIVLKWIVVGKMCEGVWHTYKSGFYAKRLYLWESCITTISDIALSVILRVTPEKMNLQFLRCLGCKIGKGVTYQFSADSRFLVAPDLLELGDGTVVDTLSDFLTFHKEHGQVYNLGRIVVGVGCRVSSHARVLPNTRLGAGVIVTPNANAQGYVDAGSIVTHSTVLPPGSPLPLDAMDTIFRKPTGAPQGEYQAHDTLLMLGTITISSMYMYCTIMIQVMVMSCSLNTYIYLEGPLYDEEHVYEYSGDEGTMVTEYTEKDVKFKELSLLTAAAITVSSLISSQVTNLANGVLSLEQRAQP